MPPGADLFFVLYLHRLAAVPEAEPHDVILTLFTDKKSKCRSLGFKTVKLDLFDNQPGY
jgi:hypothetical protein